MDWIPFVTASIPAAAAIVSAALARNSAHKVKRLEAQTQRIRDLENRLAEKKFAVYEPMINQLSEMLDPTQSAQMNRRVVGEKFNKFDAWIVIFGSDDAVGAWHRFRQAAFYDPPPVIFLRLYSDFVAAARRDMGYPDSQVEPVELIGSRLRDLYRNDPLNTRTVLSMSWAEVAKQVGWDPPWEPGEIDIPSSD